jgi:predicted TIM-barrel fold metal-dependent hydrolase
VPVIDLAAEGAAAEMGELARDTMAAGIRLVVNTPELRSELAAGRLEWFWSTAQDIPIPVMVYAPGMLPEIGEAAAKHPHLRITIDHLGLSLSARGAQIEEELGPLLALAPLPNMAVKASGLPTYSEQAYPHLDLAGPVSRVIRAFSPERVFWGSDLSRLSCTYAEAVAMMHLLVPDPDEQSLVMGAALSRWIRWKAEAPGAGVPPGVCG